LQRPALIALEAQSRCLAHRAMTARVGDLLEPARALLVQVLVVEERAAVKEALAQIADRPLDLALGPRSIGTAGPGPNLSVFLWARRLNI
jgi:hypothetical protein